MLQLFLRHYLMVTFACFLQRFAIDDDNPSFIVSGTSQQTAGPTQSSTFRDLESNVKTNNKEDAEADEKTEEVESSVFDLSKRLSCKWTTGAGPRIGCVRDYPANLQCRALEQVSLSPRPNSARQVYGPIPSPRPSPKVRVSPRLSGLGLPSPRTSIPAC